MSKRLIEENLEAQRQFSALVKNSRDFIGFTSPEGRAIFVNPAGRELVGLSEEEVQQTSPLDYVIEEIAICFSEAWQQRPKRQLGGRNTLSSFRIGSCDPHAPDHLCRRSYRERWKDRYCDHQPRHPGAEAH